MTRDEVQAVVLEILGGIAPEADLTNLAPDTGLRDELDLDSMDFLNFAIALHERFAVDIPEADYARLATVAGCVEYLSSHAGGGAPSAP